MKSTQEELWEAISQANDLLLDAMPLDPEHEVKCHADTLPQVFLQLTTAVEKAIATLQAPIMKEIEE